MTETQQQVINWLATGRVGLSSKCMAMWLAFDQKTEPNHPHDPDDLNRCLKLLEAAPGLRPLIPKMAEVSEGWALLVPHWDAVEKSHLDEVGLDWVKGGPAKKTYDLMSEIYQPLYRR